MATWTHDQESEISKLWESGLSLRAIGIEVGRSRAAVSSKLQSLGLIGMRRGAFKGASAVRAAWLASQAKREPAPPEATAARQVLDLPPRRCQYIAGEPSADPACKCGLPVRPRSSYCDEHHRLCWVPYSA